MPYKDKTQQRTAQREFARRKLAIKKAARPDINPYEGIDGAGWVPAITVDQFSKLKTFETCVRAASKFIVRGKTNCLAVAALALRVCEIERGGVRRGSGREEKKTLVKFAAAINVHYKTISGWVEAERFVQKNLPANTKRIAYSAIRDCIAYGKRNKVDPVTLYEGFALKKDPRRQVNECVKRIRYVLFYLKAHGFTHFSPEDIDLFRNWVAIVNQKLPLRVRAPQNWVEDAAAAVQ